MPSTLMLAATLIHRHQRMLREYSAPSSPDSSAVVNTKYIDRAGFCARARHRLRDQQQPGTARRVVVGAVEDAIGVRLVARLRIARAEVIVVRREHHRLLLVGALQRADHVRRGLARRALLQRRGGADD